MPLPSTVDFAPGFLDYPTRLNQLRDDMNLLAALFDAQQAGALFSATSTTSNTVGTGAKSFVLVEGAQRAFNVGSDVRITDAAAPATNYMTGMVTAYAHPNVTINVTAIGGSGTKTAWNIVTLGTSGTVPVASGGTGATTAANARTNLGLGTAATTAATDYATAAQGVTANNALPKAGGTMSGSIALGGNDVTGVQNLGFMPDFVVTPVAGAATIDWTANGARQIVTLNAATVTVTVNTPPAPGHYQLRIKQDGTGGRAISWAGALYSASRWGGSVAAPSINGNANGESLVTFDYDGATMTATLFRVGMA